jgi:hypothetical protein
LALHAACYVGTKASLEPEGRLFRGRVYVRRRRRSPIRQPSYACPHNDSVSQSRRTATLTEKLWWPQWTEDHFPSYETFWAARIVPVTYRVTSRTNIRFQTDGELAARGYTPEYVAVAQLHYTLLTHLGRVFELLDAADAFTIRGYLANRPFSPTSSSSRSPASAARATSPTSFLPATARWHTAPTAAFKKVK